MNKIDGKFVSIEFLRMIKRACEQFIKDPIYDQAKIIVKTISEELDNG